MSALPNSFIVDSEPEQAFQGAIAAAGMTPLKSSTLTERLFDSAPTANAASMRAGNSVGVAHG